VPRSNQSMIANRYRIVRLLGEGGFGAVYLAEDSRLGNKRVALKESFDRSAEALEQFRLEAQILANLQHNNLPRVTDNFIEPDGCQFLVMDYIEGRDLDEQIEHTKQPMAEREAVQIICQVAEAVAYLHTRRPQPIIHRDIKLSNIKLTGSGQAMLVDFGIAKVYHPKKGTARVAKAVSPHFSPPEQYISQTDARSDVYSLGATLYCLVTAHPPEDAMERLTKGDQLVSPTQYNPLLSPKLENVILKALRLDPNLRYPNANQLLAALRTYRSGPAAAQPSPAAVVCPSCGAPARAGVRFCTRCGASYQTPQPLPRPTPVLKTPPIDPKLNFEIANSLLQKNEYDQALQRYLACLQSGFNHPAVYQNLALCYIGLNRPQDALRMIDQGFLAHPTYLALLYEKALVHKLSGNMPEALRCARLLCQKDATQAEFFVLYGRMLMEDNQLSEAVSQLKQAVSLDSTDFDARLLLGQAYGRQDNLRQASYELNKAVKLDSQRTEPHMWLGLFHLEAGKFSQAIKHFENALKLDGSLHVAHYMIGKAYLSQKDYQRAYQSFKAAVSLNDQDPDNIVGLALAAAFLNKKNEALSLVTRVLALDPNHKDALALASRL